MSAESNGQTVDLPKRFGKYTLVERLAIGGMAEIFRATTTGVGGFEKTVVIKRLHEELSEDAEFVDMIVDEAKIAVRLNHPNIANVFDLGEIRGRYFIVMEYIEGPDASQVLGEMDRLDDRLPIPIVLRIGAEVGSALEYAHTRRDAQGRPMGIVHRDVSPPNIMLSKEGEVKLVDFGIAKARQQAQDQHEGIIKGKFHYMAPEQAQSHSRQIDPRTDVFSLGMVLYEMLAGINPYGGVDDTQDMIQTVRRAHIPSLQQHRPPIDPELDSIIMRAVEHDPDGRWQSAEQFEQALRDYMHRKCDPVDRRRIADFVGPLWHTIEHADADPGDQTAALAPEEYEAGEASILFDLDSGRARNRPSGAQPAAGGQQEGTPFDEAARTQEAAFDDVPAVDEAPLDDAPPTDENPFEEDAPTEIWDGGDDRANANSGVPSSPQHAVSAQSGSPPSPDSGSHETALPATRGDSSAPESTSNDGGFPDGMPEPPEPDPASPEPPDRNDSPPEGPDGSPDRDDGRSLPSPPDGTPSSRRSEEPAPPSSDPGPASPNRRTRSKKSRTVQADDEGETAPDESRPFYLVWGKRVREGLEQLGLQPRLVGIAALVSVVVGVLLGGIGLSTVDSSRDGGEISTNDPKASATSTSDSPQQTINLPVSSTPSGAKIKVDGDLEGRTPHTLSDLTVGRSYELTFEHESHDTETVEVEPSKDTDPVVVELAERNAVLKISTYPTDAEIRVNGDEAGYAPVMVDNLDRHEPHEITAELDGASETKTVEWSEDDDSVKEVRLTLEDDEDEPERRDERRRRARRDSRDPDPTPTRRQRRERRPHNRGSGDQEPASDDDSEPSRESSDSQPDESPASTANADDSDGDSNAKNLDIWNDDSKKNDSSSDEQTDSQQQAGGTGYVSVQVQQGWGKVYVNGKMVASETPMLRHELDAGQHRVKVYYPTIKRHSSVKVVNLGADEHEKVIFKP